MPKYSGGYRCTEKRALLHSRQTHPTVRKDSSAVSRTERGAKWLPASFSLPDDELTCHFPCAVKAFVTVIARFLFLLISLSREWSSRIESAMVCDSTVLLRLRWQPAVFWLTGCPSKICMKLFFRGSAAWWRRKEPPGQRSLGSGQDRLDCGSSCLPLPWPWPGLWRGETALVLASHFQFRLSSPKKSLSINANCALRYAKGNLEGSPEALKFYKNFRYLASKLSVSACTYSDRHPPLQKPHSTGRGEDVLTFSLTLQISPASPGLAQVSAMPLARPASLLPLLPVRPARWGFDLLACLVGLYSTNQKRTTSLCLLLVPISEWDKADEQGTLILFPRAPHVSGNRDPESGIPFPRLSTVHRQHVMNLNVWCRNCRRITPCVSRCSPKKWTDNPNCDIFILV